MVFREYLIIFPKTISILHIKKLLYLFYYTILQLTIHFISYFSTLFTYLSFLSHPLQLFLSLPLCFFLFL